MVGGMPRYAATAGAPVSAVSPRPVVVDPAAAPAELKAALAGLDGLVVGAEVAPAEVRTLLDAAASAGVEHAVLLSSATVYGAWADNPVPLSEDCPLRPNPGFAFAAERAEAERLVADWRDAHPGSTAAVLRPALGASSTLERVLNGTAGLRSREASRPVQFLADDDLAGAVALALADRVDGAFNVAPDGWVPDETARALAGGPTRVAIPERAARAARAVVRVLLPGAGASRRWPGIEPYTRHPWVVANDRLRAAGWAPRLSNEEAFVEASGGGVGLSPKRRQEVALAGSAVVLAGAAAAVVALVRRRRRR
jgi:nucleoside-diphosphate-sugar epimerase